MSSNKCVDCNNANVCKYKEKYQEILSKLRSNIEDPFELVLACKYHYSTFVHLRSRDYSDYSDCSNNTTEARTPYLPGTPEIVY